MYISCNLLLLSWRVLDTGDPRTVPLSIWSVHFMYAVPNSHGLLCGKVQNLCTTDLYGEYTYGKYSISVVHTIKSMLYVMRQFNLPKTISHIDLFSTIRTSCLTQQLGALGPRKVLIGRLGNHNQRKRKLTTPGWSRGPVSKRRVFLRKKGWEIAEPTQI